MKFKITATKEAMGLAGMNPVCGISSNHGSLMVNVMNHDKDLETGWGDYKAVTRSLDPNDNLYGIDPNGRVIAKHKFDVMDQKDIVEVFNIKTPNVDTIMESIEREASLPYDRRPVHSQSYIYEAFTGKKLLSEDQYTYDPLLERVELDKWSKILSGEADNMNPPKEDKDANYIPDNGFPQGTENIQNPGIVLASANMGNAQDSFNKAINIIQMALNSESIEFKKTIIINPNDRLYKNDLKAFLDGKKRTVTIGGWDIWKYPYDRNNEDEVEQHDRYFKAMRPFVKKCNTNLSKIGCSLQAGTYEEYEEGQLILKHAKGINESSEERFSFNEGEIYDNIKLAVKTLPKIAVATAKQIPSLVKDQIVGKKVTLYKITDVGDTTPFKIHNPEIENTSLKDLILKYLEKKKYVTKYDQYDINMPYIKLSTWNKIKDKHIWLYTFNNVDTRFLPKTVTPNNTMQHKDMSISELFKLAHYSYRVIGVGGKIIEKNLSESNIPSIHEGVFSFIKDKLSQPKISPQEAIVRKNIINKASTILPNAINSLREVPFKNSLKFHIDEKDKEDFLNGIKNTINVISYNSYDYLGRAMEDERDSNKYYRRRNQFAKLVNDKLPKQCFILAGTEDDEGYITLHLRLNKTAKSVTNDGKFHF